MRLVSLAGFEPQTLCLQSRSTDHYTIQESTPEKIFIFKAKFVCVLNSFQDFWGMFKHRQVPVKCLQTPCLAWLGNFCTSRWLPFCFLQTKNDSNLKFGIPIPLNHIYKYFLCFLDGRDLEDHFPSKLPCLGNFCISLWLLFCLFIKTVSKYCKT